MRDSHMLVVSFWELLDIVCRTPRTKHHSVSDASTLSETPWRSCFNIAETLSAADAEQTAVSQRQPLEHGNEKLISICDCIISIIATTAVPGFVIVTCNAALRYVLAGVTLQLTRRFQTLLHLKQSHTYKSEHLLFYSVVLEHAATSSGIASTSSSGIASAISYSLALTISCDST